MCLRPSLFQATMLALALATSALAPPPAAAHPHVTVTAKAKLVVQDGKVVAIEHHWTFDEFYSTFLGQGLDADKDGKLSAAELKGLADINIESLAEVGYFTVVKSGGKPVEYTVPKTYRMESDGKAITLIYTLPLATAAPLGKSLGLEVYDPSFFVSFGYVESDDAVTLDGAPAGCKIVITRPKPLAQTPLSKLGEDYWANAGMGAQFSSRAIVACP